MPAFFAKWQARYADFGLPIFPIEGKKPLIRNFQKVGLQASAKLVLKFPAAESFGLNLGQRTNISVLDIDTADKNILQQALVDFGQTPFVVRTGGGHYQAWYCHNGERRCIRPFHPKPIDILGRGFVVAPPSRSGQGYEVIRGSLMDLHRLPPMCLPVISSEAENVGEGERNNALFRFALRQARHCDDEAQLLDVVQTKNENGYNPPLGVDEVGRVVKSAWRYEVEGRNFVATASTFATRAEVRDLGPFSPHSLALLMMLRSFHRKGDRFALAQAMAATLGWTIRRFRKARGDLEGRGLIRCLHAGGRGPNDPPIYELG